MSQKQEALRYMQRYGSITHKEAEASFGCTRIAARICELKKDGVNIPKPDCSKGYAVYTLGESVPESLF